MHYCMILLFGILLAGCVKPVQMEIPADHPANPGASAAPAVVQNDYIFHLPDDKPPEKSASAESGHVPGMGHHEDSPKNHTGHESMSLEKTGGGHAH
jgi:hypothetical protein